MKLVEQGDGSAWTTLYLHQSDIDSYRKCPEQVRAAFKDDLFDPDSDSAYIGTLTHSFIEECLHWYRATGEWPSETQIIEFLGVQQASLGEAWDSLWLHPHQVKDLEQGQKYLANCCVLWWNEIRPQLSVTNPEMWLIEHKFDICIDKKATGARKVNLRGSIDFFDGVAIWDWKTGSSRYAWMKHRYDIQSTVYTWAMSNHLGGGVEVPFNLAFCPREKNETTIIPLTRGLGHWGMMIEEALAIARHVWSAEGDNRQWPLGPTDWWCSERWCALHAQGKCMGAVNPIYPEEAVYLTRLIGDGVERVPHGSDFDE